MYHYSSGLLLLAVLYLHAQNLEAVCKKTPVAQQLSYYVCVQVIHNTCSLGPLALVASVACVCTEAVFSIILLSLFLQSFSLHPRSAFASHIVQVI